MIKDNLGSVRKQIADTAAACGRDADTIQLLAVSKTFPIDCILQAVAAGQMCFGENYVDEAIDKISALASRGIEWHFIGAIQSNKTRVIATHFDWVQSVDREKIALRLQEQRPAEYEPLNVCIQVNVDEESTKSGALPDEVASLAKMIRACDRLKLRGLMAIPRASGNADEQLASFTKVAALYEGLRQEGYELDTLSMGMSADFVMAIKAGSTMLRIGSGIFGKRTAS
ncbi:MAG: YggS family pyridoxal phosphate-dependent enzyme [Gammaproteobacteria bacterium]|nr:YggS family pyridoxal phosphate-dependent enzyme [Gammaproteobacteria bacterium]